MSVLSMAPLPGRILLATDAPTATIMLDRLLGGFGRPARDDHEVTDLEQVRRDVVPLMVEAGYEFIWRPTMGDDAPFYAWFIKRDDRGERSVHVHMVEPGQASVDRIVFRDYLRDHPEEVERYEALKRDLAKQYPNDRTAYTEHKGNFVTEALAKARQEKMKR